MTMHRRVCAAVLAGLLATTAAPATGASADAPANWAQDGFGPGNTGVNPHERAITTGNAGALRYRWSILSGVSRGSCMFQAPPVIADGRLFVADQSGFGAYRAGTGARIWRRTVAMPAGQETPAFAVAGSMLLAAVDDCGSTSDPDGDLSAYDAATGRPLWTVHRDAPLHRMVVDRDVVVVGGGDAAQDVVSAYRRRDGAPLWSRADVELGANVSADGRLLLTRTDHSGAVAVDIGTGRPLWTTKRDWTVAAADGRGTRLFVGDPAGRLTAVSAADGAVLWTADGVAGQQGADTMLAVDADRVYAVAGEHLVALRAGDGRRMWDQDLYGWVGRPVLAGGVLYATVENQPLAILDPRTGASLDPDPMVAGARGHAVVVGGRLYVTDGRVLDVYSA
jgi:outer membrane protein assembly factor BamB